MKNFLKQTGKTALEWTIKNPKKFFTYSMVFLSVSFVGSLVMGIFLPSESAFKIKPPMLYSKSNKSEQVGKNQEKEMEKIVNELQTLKLKRDRKELQKEDSLRIEYLYNQYQELKNGR